MQHATMKLVEELAGEGQLARQGQPLGRARYRLSRYQAMLVGSGMPVPGLHRIEGSIEAANGNPGALVGLPLTLTLEDGRSVAITVADAEGRILTEGHGPGSCSCC